MRFSHRVESHADRAQLRRLVKKQIIPLTLLIVFGWVLFDKAQSLDFDRIFAAVNAIQPWQWAIATLAAGLSFWSISYMDAVVHRLMNTGYSTRAAQVSGTAAVATAQIIGFGLLTGTLARWRILPGISLMKAAQITAAVSITFMIALGAVTAVMVLITGPSLPWARPFAVVGLVAILALIGVMLWKPRFMMRVNLPPLRALLTMTGLTVMDAAAAALTLYVLMPASIQPDPVLFFTVYLMALGVGLLGTTPGGVGPFELMLLGCFATLPEPHLLAAIMGYRIVYFAVPAALAVGVLICGPWLAWMRPDPARTRKMRHPLNGQRPVPVGALSFNATRAEAGLMRQGELELLCQEDGAAVSLVAPTGQSLIMLSDPFSERVCAGATLAELQDTARRRFLYPCLYKCSARTAIKARHKGWKVLRISDEAIIDTLTFDLAAPRFRQLRRQLRKAEKSGITVIEAGPRVPLAEMRRVADDWGCHRKGIRGFSMGRFTEDYVRSQRIFLAYRAEKLIGFVSFHENWRERALDLMCHTQDAPHGTMHLLIASAIQSAAKDGCGRLSLAAVPRMSDILPERAAAWVDRHTGSVGLTRFKTAFAPRWEPLYLVAPGRLALGLTAVDLVDRITRPRPLIKHRS